MTPRAQENRALGQNTKILSSSNSSIANNAGDDATVSDPHQVGRPLSTGAIPDSSRFKDLSIRESSSQVKSRKRPAEEPPKGGTGRRGVNSLKFHALDPAFDRGYIQDGIKSQAQLFDPDFDSTGRLPLNPERTTNYDFKTAVASTIKGPDPRVDSFRPSQPQGWISPPHILKKGSLSMPGDTHGHTLIPTARSLAQDLTPDLSGQSEYKMLKQPETRPISEDQLVKEVRGIYAGLVMVEKKCMEIDQQQALAVKKLVEGHAELEKLTTEQWKALIALHRTLLHEHHDFFLASQHPSASPSLKRLAKRYSMPARMWRHGIHSFLELLRHRLPDSLEHMLTFIYLTYSMMTLLVESVPAFEDTWIECLGDLARYRMAVEDANVQEREVWAGVARYWYNKGADRNPKTGRIQHHLAVLARSNVLQQLFFYTKSLICVDPFPNTRESMLQLFNSASLQSESAHRRLPIVMTSFTNAHRILYTCGSVSAFINYVDEFISYLDNQIGRVGAKWREQGVYIASTNIAAIFGYGKSLIGAQFNEVLESKSNSSQLLQNAHQYWQSPPQIQLPADIEPPTSDEITITASEESTLASQFAFYNLDSVVQCIGDKNVIPFVHVSLAFLWTASLVPESMRGIEMHVPWRGIERFLNTLAKQGTSESRIETQEFPQSGTILPEDFLMRGQVWSELYYPPEFFDNSPIDIDERPLELPSIAVPRAERCLWLGVRIAAFNRWLTYDSERKTFSTTEFALGLEKEAKPSCLFGRQPKVSSPGPRDTKMVDAGSR